MNEDPQPLSPGIRLKMYDTRALRGLYHYYFNWLTQNPFRTKQYYSTEFFRFLCQTLSACHTVNNSLIMLKSSLLDRELSQLSGEKTEVIYLKYLPFYNFSSIMFDFLAKKCPKRCMHC